MYVFTMTGVSSPLSTGGAGTVFEQHVGAMFLALLLTRGIPVIFRDYQVDKVDFQTSRLGWETDDLLVTCSSENITRKMAIQIRRSFAVRKSDGCKETIQRFWNDFNADRFNPNRDALILATLSRTDNLGGFNSLLACARSSPGAADFKDRLETPKFVSDTTRRCYQQIRSIVDSVDSSDSVSEDRFWCFLKTMYVLFFDFTTDTAQHEAMVTQLLAQSSGDSDAVGAARDTWHKLVAVASDTASRAKQFCRSDLPASLLERYSAISAPKLQKLMDHSTTILNGIYSTIGKAATLSRTEVTTQTSTALGNRVVALTGPPGSGKSALAKAVIEQHSGSHLCLSFRATEFAKSHIDDVLLDTISGEQFKLLVGAQERVLIYVDGFERLLECSVRDALDDLVEIVESCPNVSLMLTCRDSEIENAVAAFFNQRLLTCHKVMVPPLSADEMEQVCKDNPSLRIPISHPELKQVMGTPYVLDMAARMDWSNRQDIPADIMAFQKKWWSEIVRNDGETADGLPDRREQALVNLAVYRARELRPFVPTEGADKGALDRLCKDGIVLMGDGGLAALAHDVIEDWAVIHWVGSCALKHEWSTRPMAKDVGTNPAIRRGFREWLKEELDTNAAKTDRFVLSAYGDDSLPSHFRDDVLISLLISNFVQEFIARQKDRILNDDARLLVRMMHLTRMACTKSPESDDGRTIPKSLLMEPDGEAWPVLLEVIADNLENLLPAHTMQIVGFLEDWLLGVRSLEPAGINPAGRIAYRLLEQPDYEYEYDLRKRVLKIIVQIPGADEDSFLDLIERASPDSQRNGALSDEFGSLLTNGVNGFLACLKFPEKMSQFTRSLFLTSKDNSGGISFSPHNEYEFGIRTNTSFDFFPDSAFHGPFWALLKCSPNVGINLILDILNHAGDWYGKRKGGGYLSESRTGHTSPIAIAVPGSSVVQWADDTLWQAYRGTPNVPNVIKCALMALEYWLLEVCENQDLVEPLLLRILRGSNNVMTTAVVASVCCAYPTFGGSVTLALLKSLECIRLDRSRLAKEHQTTDAVTSGSDPLDRWYADERRKSNALPHRREDISALAVKIQSTEQRDLVWEVIDGHRVDIPDIGRTDKDRKRLLMLYEMDIRRLKRIDTAPPPDGGNAEDESGKAILVLDADEMDADLLRFYNTAVEESQQYSAAPSLLNWGLRQWKQNSGGENAEFWRQALTSARDDYHYDAEHVLRHILERGPSVVAAVCVRDHWDEMDGGDRQWCIDVLVSAIERDSDDHYLVAHMLADTTGTGHAAFILPSILMRDHRNERILKAVVRAVTHGSVEVSIMAAEGVAKYLGPQHHSLVLRCVGAAAMLSNRLAQYERQHTRVNRQVESNTNYDIQQLLKYVRGAVVDGSVNVREELTELDIEPQHGRNAALYVMRMLDRKPNLSLTKDFFARTGKTIMDVWIDERENRGGLVDSQLWDSVTNGLVDILLVLPPDEIPFYCRPFLDAVDKHPGKLEWFVVTLIRRGIAAPVESSFWDIWRAFSRCIVDASWSFGIRTRDSTGSILVDKMLFNIGWRNDRVNLPLLINHEDDVNSFVTNLPATPPVLTSFAHYLYSVGESALPGALTVVAERLQTEDTLDGSAVSCLAAILQRYVYGRPQSLKADPVLRKSTLTILDRLVDAGSSAAYRMRDDFTTPNAS